MSQYIIEFQQIGRYIKVSAADPATCRETFVVVPAGKGIAKSDMSKLAVKKLEFILKKSKETQT